jgi:hypothetical protein
MAVVHSMRKKDRRAGFVVSGEFILSYEKGRESWTEPEVTFPGPPEGFFALSPHH